MNEETQQALASLDQEYWFALASSYQSNTEATNVLSGTEHARMLFTERLRDEFSHPSPAVDFEALTAYFME